MGCFKTSTGAWLIDRKVGNVGNVIIVTTKSGKGPWFDAAPRCLDMDEWRIFNVGTKLVEEVILDDLRIESDVDDLVKALTSRKQKVLLLAHYHTFMNKSFMREVFEAGIASNAFEWDFFGVDEAHRMKDKGTQWTRNIKKQSRYAKSRHLMTGTGFVNNPAEIWSLLNFLEPKKFTSYWKFRRTYCLEENWSGYDKIVGIKSEKIDEFISLRRSLGPRRTMEEVHKDIAEPIYHSIEVDLNPTQRRMYKEIVQELRMLDQQGVPIHSPNVVSQLQRLRQISVATPELVASYFDEKLDRMIQEVRLVEPSSKLDAVMDVIEGLEWDTIDSPESIRQQMVVFSNFKDPLELLKVRLDKVGVSYIHMEQKDSEATRFEKWHDIWPSKQHQIFMCTVALGGESINLSSAQYCVFLDRSWSPAQNLQAVGRVYRPGQTGAVEIIHIDARKTVDKRVMDNVNTKVSWFRRLFDDEE
jgi:chromodomain-helicase-DNA-binding protein 7